MSFDPVCFWFCGSVGNSDCVDCSFSEAVKMELRLRVIKIFTSMNLWNVSIEDEYESLPTDAVD